MIYIILLRCKLSITMIIMFRVNYLKGMSLSLFFPIIAMCGRYDFLLFENFELMKKSFITEQKLARNLHIIRQFVGYRMVVLNENAYNRFYLQNIVGITIEMEPNLEYGTNFYLKSISDLLHNEKKFSIDKFYTSYEEIKQEYEPQLNYQKLYEVSTTNIMKAAVKGVIILQATYNQKIQDYSGGHLSFKSGNKCCYRTKDSLQADDLAFMSVIAFCSLHWYDSGLKYLKASLDMFYFTFNRKIDERSRTLQNLLLIMKEQYPMYHNAVFNKKSNLIGPDWKVYPRIVDIETLEFESNETTELKAFGSILKAIEVDREQHYYPAGQMRDTLFQNVCNGNIKGNVSLTRLDMVIHHPPKCHFIHHFSPFLIIGPFHLDVKLYSPFRTVIHDFFTDKEMNWMLEYSLPRLSASRELPEDTISATESDHRYNFDKSKGFSVAKAVQTWFRDINYKENQTFVQSSPQGKSLAYEHPPLKDPYSYTIVNEIMYHLSRKIELVTNFNVTTRYGASAYQTTNYGLAGMVVPHVDPWGYEQGVELTNDRFHLSRSGDYIATFMGWFEETVAGGNTAFIKKQYEGTLQPTKGSAAFWTSLSSCHLRDERSEHGGCPVLKGTKWIVNKWIYSWAQWKNWPCYLKPNASILPFKGISS